MREEPIRARLEALKARQQIAWASGDYAVIGSTLQGVGESLAEAIDVSARHRVLDVAAGNGNFALAAARRGCEVVASDYVPAFLQGAAQRAAAERLPLGTLVADAERLPFAEGWFDVVGSTFGVMFAPDQERAASEMLRVCRRGGRIGLACWTPTGLVGRLFATVAELVPPAPGARSPALWGTEERVRELFGAHACEVRVTRRHHAFRHRSAEAWLDTFRACYGPLVSAFAALEGARRDALAGALLRVAKDFDRATDGALCAMAEYLEIVVVTR